MQNFSLERGRKRAYSYDFTIKEPDTLSLQDNSKSFQYGHVAIMQQSQLQIEEEETTDFSQEEGYLGTTYRHGFFSNNEAQTINEEERDELRNATSSDF